MQVYDSFCPQRYLRQFYSSDTVPHDEQVIYGAIAKWLGDNQRVYATAIEVGCGPTIHHALPLVGFVQKLTMADYLLSNRAVVADWLTNPDHAHDWSARARCVLEFGNKPPDRETIQQLLDELRRTMQTPRHCDLTRTKPMGTDEVFDLATAYYTLENVACGMIGWRNTLANFASLCNDGGDLLVVAAANCSGYEVEGLEFPTEPINESHFLDHLPDFGFHRTQIELQTHRVFGWEEKGIERIIICGARGKIETKAAKCIG